MVKRTCSLHGCPLPHSAKGYCWNHYRRWRETGDPGPVAIRARRAGPRKQCEVDGCDEVTRARGLCNMHYKREVKGKGVGPAHRVGQGAYAKPCSVEGCPATKHRAWGLCSVHYGRMKGHGSTDAVVQQTYRRGPSHPYWKEVPEYLAMHRRVVKARGRARDHPCAECGGKARQWSYDHTDPDEVVSKVGLTTGCVYSLDITRYRPMCYPCHTAFDLERRRAARRKAGYRRPPKPDSPDALAS